MYASTRFNHCIRGALETKSIEANNTSKKIDYLTQYLANTGINYLHFYNYFKTDPQGQIEFERIISPFYRIFFFCRYKIKDDRCIFSESCSKGKWTWILKALEIAKNDLINSYKHSPQGILQMAEKSLFAGKMVSASNEVTKAEIENTVKKFSFKMETKSDKFYESEYKKSINAQRIILLTSKHSQNASLEIVSLWFTTRYHHFSEKEIVDYFRSDEGSGIFKSIVNKSIFLTKLRLSGLISMIF